MEQKLSIINNPRRCRHLESKGMYINVNMPAGQEVAGDGHFWCEMTQTAFGPDNGLCNDEECVKSGRSCFKAL